MPSRYHESTKLGSRRTVSSSSGLGLRVAPKIDQDPSLVIMRGRSIRSESYGLCEFRQGAIEIKLVREGDAEIQMCVRRLGIQLDDSAKIRDGFASLIQTGEGPMAREVSALVLFGSRRKALLKSLARFRESRLAGQDEAEIHKCLGVLRIVLDRLPEQLLRFSGLALLA